MADPKPPSGSGPSLEDIRRALAVQYTPPLRDKLLRFAENRVKQMRWARRPPPKNYAKELVHDAMTSIWLGLRRWDPHQDLEARLRFLIKERTSREMSRAQKYEHVSYDLAANDSDVVNVKVEEKLAATAPAPASPLVSMHMAIVARQVAAEMVILAHDDGEVRGILACWERGITEPQDIMAITGLSESAFKHARERILRLARHLPPELREAAYDLLRSA